MQIWDGPPARFEEFVPKPRATKIMTRIGKTLLAKLKEETT